LAGRRSREPYPLVPAFGRWRLSISALSLVVAAFLLLPIIVIVPASFSSGSFLTWPPNGFSGRWYSNILSDPQWRSAFEVSLRVAGEAAAVATVTGLMAALALRRLTGPRRAVLRAFFIAPLILPVVVYALGLFDLFSRLGVFGGTWTIVVGQAVLAFPVTYVMLSAALASVDPAITRAAASLGARWPMIVLRVEAPLVRGAIVAAAIVAFGFCFDEVVIALFLSNPTTRTLPVAIFQAALDSASPAVAAVSGYVILIALLTMALAATAARWGARDRAT
jgi:putative spermidine/putrescine transport system permease protein